MIYLTLFYTFFKIGLFTFGGGYAMLPLIQEEIVRHGWMSVQDLVNFIAVSESTPGPFAVNISTYVGVETAGFPGGLCATLGVILPSFVIILAVAGCYQKFCKSRIVRGCMSGLKPAVLGLIGTAVISTGKTVFFPVGITFGTDFFLSLVIFLIMLACTVRRLHPILIVVLSACLGIVAGVLFGI